MHSCISGLDWHPNMHMNQSLITQGDLPRFVMDSYEECRGPPRLFLLDKYIVGYLFYSLFETMILKNIYLMKNSPSSNLTNIICMIASKGLMLRVLEHV